MNDQTPKRLGGSLVERAAAHQAFVQRQAAQQAAAQAPVAPPVAKPRHDIPVFGAVEAPRAPLVRPEPAAAVAPVQQVVQEPSTRRRVAIDRKKLAEHGMLVPGATVTARVAAKARMTGRG
jgi:hypothetical protein